MRTLIVGACLASVLTLSACSKTGKIQKFSEEELETNPAANFVRGMEVLNKTDRKTGQVDYLTALTYFQKSSALGGGPKASFNAGWVAEQVGDSSAAENEYRRAYDADPDYDKALYSLTRVLSEQGRDDEVVAIFASYADRHPHDNNIRNDYIAALVSAGQGDKAVDEAQRVLRRDPDNAGIYRNLSALYYAQGNYGMSQLTAEKALALNDGDAGVYNNLGVTHLIQGSEPKAITQFKVALKLDPKNYEANMNLGFVSLNSGDYDLAKTCFDAALESNPTSWDAKLGLAVATRGTKDYKKADQLYGELIKANPSNEAAYFNAATLHEKYTKDFAKAMKYLDDYRGAQQDSISLNDPVFARMEHVRMAQEAEAERKRIEDERKRAEEERRQRNAELLAQVGTAVTETAARVQANLDCLEEEMLEEINMFLEQAQMIVDAEEVDMAPDMQTMLDDYYIPVLDGAIDWCNMYGTGEEESGETTEGAATEEGGEAAGEEGGEAAGEESGAAEPETEEAETTESEGAEPTE